MATLSSIPPISSASVKAARSPHERYITIGGIAGARVCVIVLSLSEKPGSDAAKPCAKPCQPVRKESGIRGVPKVAYPPGVQDTPEARSLRFAIPVPQNRYAIKVPTIQAATKPARDLRRAKIRLGSDGVCFPRRRPKVDAAGSHPVSYTHLTLPTICSV